jgi:hypothetical protein
MRHSQRLLFTLFGAICGTAALAQNPGSAPVPAPPQQPNPGQTIPERVVPPPPGERAPDSRRDESLSDRLDRTDGVLPTPPNVAPTMPVIPPADPGTTPVIPPPPPGQTPQR